MIDHATTVYQLQQILAGSYDQNLFLLMTLKANILKPTLTAPNANIVESKWYQASIVSDGKVSSVAIFTNNKAVVAFAIKLCGAGEVLFHSTTHN